MSFHKIITFPDLVIVCGMSNVIKDFDRLLQSSATQPQLLSYDTTFQLGDFYVSTLPFRNVLFDSAPVMPSFFCNS